jgi:hypothetical protein
MGACTQRKTKDFSVKKFYKVPFLKTNKIFSIIICVIMAQHNTAAQWKAGIGQYSYTSMPLAEAIVPVGYIQSANNWYAELRYNYEEAKTFSLYGGKTFSGGNNLEYTLTPMAGFSTGRFTGVSFAANAEAEWKNFFFSSQTQYSISVKKKDSIVVKGNTGRFFFNWSELGYNISDLFFGGLSMQYTRQTGENNFEPGFLAGLNFKNLSFPCYVFSPFRPGRYFVLGVNYEFNFTKKK